ncbi:aldo/keto reductase [Methyloligella solikamskensis]|uniref:Aldo/keto reductase n=1 Tax=Methyloligella solikamskensis TaxID=1177756 RepID=A0ABW3JCL5_9HYPH
MSADGGSGGGAAHGEPTPQIVSLPGGGNAPALGMGSWQLAEGRHPIEQEKEALQTGLSLGMTLIDTAEMYGSGASEEMVGTVIAGQREKVFLVSKVLPTNATRAEDIRSACAGSLKRLKTDFLDLYLLHWRGGVRQLDVVVDAFESLKEEGKIRRWGVSNFGVADMEELFGIDGGGGCATNQVDYSLTTRGIEADLIPWSVREGVPIMAYSPLGTGSGHILDNPVLAEVADRHGVTPAAVAIAWTMRNGETISIPESGTLEHIREDAAALGLKLSEEDLADLDRAFPA